MHVLRIRPAPDGAWRVTSAPAAGSEPTTLRPAPHDDVDALAGRLAGVRRIELHFADEKEGRGYSQARILRERLGYTGELRATGWVTRDRLADLARCGFDAFVVDEALTVEAARRALTALTVVYQGAGDTSRPVPWRRGWRRGASSVVGAGTTAR